MILSYRNYLVYARLTLPPLEGQVGGGILLGLAVVCNVL